MLPDAWRSVTKSSQRPSHLLTLLGRVLAKAARVWSGLGPIVKFGIGQLLAEPRLPDQQLWGKLGQLQSSPRSPGQISETRNKVDFPAGKLRLPR